MALAAILASCHQAQLAQVMDTVKARWGRAVCPPELPAVSVVWGPRKLQCGKDPNAWGCHWNGGKIAVSRSTPDKYVLHVLMHEYGHALDAQETPGVGVLDHVPAGWGVMGPSVSAARDKITESDIGLVCRKRVCLCRRPEE